MTSTFDASVEEERDLGEGVRIQKGWAPQVFADYPSTSCVGDRDPRIVAGLQSEQIEGLQQALRTPEVSAAAYAQAIIDEPLKAGWGTRIADAAFATSLSYGIGAALATLTIKAGIITIGTGALAPLGVGLVWFGARLLANQAKAKHIRGQSLENLHAILSAANDPNAKLKAGFFWKGAIRDIARDELARRYRKQSSAPLTL